jgi:hypothetical protein
MSIDARYFINDVFNGFTQAILSDIKNMRTKYGSWLDVMPTILEATAATKQLGQVYTIIFELWTLPISYDPSN